MKRNFCTEPPEPIRTEPHERNVFIIRVIREIRGFSFGTRAKLSAPSHVLVRGNKIEKISTRAIPTDKRGDTVIIDGTSKTLKLAVFKGRYVLLDFKATWCGPCVAELPHLKETCETFGKDVRFAMIGLNLDPEADAPKEFAANNKVKWTQGFLGDWSKASLPGEYGVDGIPALFLIGPDGKIAAKGMRGEDIQEAVGKALENK